ncbi:unnamed protein product [Phytophthora lilii]|uniref:Unnamed protein product n=1 Tax=Phytophthora lilii TaxID=2077276 RepID=A0A9W6WLD5_9STRA|nr:unnamed protein product [Phytophthora lilii]
MEFLPEDEAALEAALTFLDELVPGPGLPGDALPALLSVATTGSQEEPTDDSNHYTASQKPKTQGPRRRTRTKKPETEEEKKRRKAELNERRKLLRKAGVYGDANRARNARSREIAYLRDQMEKLQVDLEVLQCRKATEEKDRRQENVTTLARNKSTQITSMWQGLAEQQKRRREEAERDNALLKLAIERQRKVADSLRSLMQKRAVQLVREVTMKSVAKICAGKVFILVASCFTAIMAS